MRKTLTWVMVLLLLNALNYVGWDLSKEFIIFDLLTAIILGMGITFVNILFNKSHNKYSNWLFLSLMFGLLVMPFILHYGVAIKLLEQSIRSNPLVCNIYLQGFFYAVKKTLYVMIFSYPIIAIIYSLNSIEPRIKKLLK
jgi:hypothetical protein